MRASGIIANGIPILLKVLVEEIYYSQILADAIMMLGQFKCFTLAESIHIQLVPVRVGSQYAHMLCFIGLYRSEQLQLRAIGFQQSE